MTEQSATQTEDLVLVNRVFDAPRELVFAAWTDPDQVAKWWGPPVGFHTPRESVDIELRVGGHFNLDMVQDDPEATFPCRFEILELVEPELIVLKSPAQPELGLTTDTVCRVEFHDEGGRTRLTLTDGPYGDSEMRGGAEAGWTGSLETLDALLARG